MGSAGPFSFLKFIFEFSLTKSANIYIIILRYNMKVIDGMKMKIARQDISFSGKEVHRKEE
jgi:hypothetical protein